MYNPSVKRKIRKRLAATLLVTAFAISLGKPTAALAAASPVVTHSVTVTDEMNSAEYWINKLEKPDKVLAHEKKIKKMNFAMLHGEGTSMYDLAHASRTFDGVKLRNSLAGGAIPSRQYYIKGEAIEDQAAYFEAIYANIASGWASYEQKVGYGICVKRADMKSYPTADVLGYSATDCDDELQSSAMIVNEPALILLTTGDGKFNYVKSTNCTGWIPSECIARVQKRSDWLSKWKTSENFLVVTQDRIITEPSLFEPDTAGVELNLGCRLNLVPKEEMPLNLSERCPWNNYMVYLPLRAANGDYYERPVLIAQHYSVSVGYLPFTQRNLLTVAFSCLGNRYGWGGMLSSMDCSMYTRNIYRCFGFELPRNTTWQNAIPSDNYDVTEKTAEEKLDILRTCYAGTLLFFRGHMTMFVGMEGDNAYVISATGSVVEDGIEGIYKVNTVIVNGLDINRASAAADGGTTWLNHMATFIRPWKPLNK